MKKPLVALLALPLFYAMADGSSVVEEHPADYSFDAGVEFMTKASESWRNKHKCVTCHTNGWGLAAQPLIAPKSDEVESGRQFAQGYLDDYLKGTKKNRGQHGSVTGMVATTAFLAFSDARTKGEIHEATRRGLDYAWDRLDASDTWDAWLQCNWPPFESDAEYGPTLMLIALGELQDKVKLHAKDLRGIRRLIKYLNKHEPTSLHAKVMRLWAASHWPKAVRKKSQQTYRKELLAAINKDGGWSMASLSGPTWQRDGGEAQTTSSEAYPTAFCVYVLMELGMQPTDKIIKTGLDWLRDRQQERGDWQTRSPRRDGKHYISRAATAFALMALAPKH